MWVAELGRGEAVAGTDQAVAVSRPRSSIASRRPTHRVTEERTRSDDRRRLRTRSSMIRSRTARIARSAVDIHANNFS